MLAILPFLCWLAWVLVALIHQRTVPSRPASLRQACVTATILFGIWTVAGTELLSLCHGISRWPIFAWWSAALAAGLVILFLGRRRLVEIWPKYQLDRRERCALALILLLLLLPGLAAVFAPPSNWDSMTYHLTRQMYWMQQQSVEHHPANRSFQLSHPPFAEFVGVHLMALSGGDRFANFPQWFSFLMTALVASLICRELGGDRKTQMLASLLVLLIPTAYIWASNTKNDLVLALWASIAAWWAIRLVARRQVTMLDAVLIGTTFGLMALTKSTALFCGIVTGLIVAFGVVLYRKHRFWQPALVMAVCVLAITAGHWSRNHKVFGSISGSAQFVRVHTNDLQTPAALTSNVVRNLTLHLATPVENWNRSLFEGVTGLHEILNLDVSDKRTTAHADYAVTYTPELEDSTPAPAHALLMLLLAPIALAWPRQFEQPRLIWLYTMIPLIGFLLFCFVLKWQPWHTRLHVPLLCLSGPALALILSRRPIARIAPILVLATMIAYVPTLRDNDRPLFGKDNVFSTAPTTQRFRRCPALHEPTVRLADMIGETKFKRIGLYFGIDDLEYPIMRLVRDRTDDPVQFSPFLPNVLGERTSDGALPEMVVHLHLRAGQYGDAPSWQICHPDTGIRYHAIGQFSPYTVYLREDVVGTDGSEGQLDCQFLGWHRHKGLEVLEGPFPHAGLPGVFRWGLGPQTTLKMKLDAPQQVYLLANCRCLQNETRSFTILTNGDEVHRVTVTSESRQVALPLSLESGTNEIVFRYETWKRQAPRPLAVIFTRLLLIPKPEVEQHPQRLLAIQGLRRLHYEHTAQRDGESLLRR